MNPGLSWVFRIGLLRFIPGLVPRWFWSRGLLSRGILANGVFAMGLGLASCNKPPAQRDSAESAQQSGVRTYVVRGIVRGTPDLIARDVMVQHEDVPGFMPAMTMAFDFRDPQEVAALREGDAVEFKLFITEKESWIANVQQIDPAGVSLPVPPTPTRSASQATRVKEGEPMPAFELVDQGGRTIRRESFSGRFLLVTFIFTRCPIPNYCPLMGQNLRAIQKEIRADPELAGRVNLLSISFDEHDTPALLAQYGATFTDDFESWQFATGKPEEVEKLTRAFAVRVEPENGTISHGLTTALIGPDGVVRHLWRGNGWKPDEVLAALRTLSVPAPRTQ